MRIIHLADLHLGKIIHGISLLENRDQTHWVDAFLELAEQLEPDAVVIAGDVYDRSAPSGDAVTLLSRMVSRLDALGIPVMMTAGNHDSAQRMAFGRDILARSGLHISAPLIESPELIHVTLEDAYGPVTFWLMPYVFPASVAKALGGEAPGSYDGAVRALLAAQPIDFTQRNVLIAHQNVTAGGCEGTRGGSESMVGGVGQVDYTAFDGFDYVALGHIHAAYPVGRDAVRYAGSPLCYHFNEVSQPAKGPVLVELGEKDAPVRIETKHISPLHPMRVLRGTYEQVRDELRGDTRKDEYLRVVLTDRFPGPEAQQYLRDICKARGSLLLELTSEYVRSGGAGALSAGAAREKRVDELFADFYAERMNCPPDGQDLSLLAFAAEQLQHANAHEEPDAKTIDKLIDVLMTEEAVR